MKLQFAVWIAIIALLQKSACISSDINQVASERRDFEGPSDYSDEENAEKIIENDLLFGTSLRDFPATDATLSSSSTSDIPKITWSLVSLSKNSTSQFTRDDASEIPQTKTKASTLSIEATTSMPRNQNSSAFQNFTSSFSNALNSGDNELDSDVSGISTDRIPHGEIVSTKDYKSSSSDTTTPYPDTEFLERLIANVKVNSSEVSINFENDTADETTTHESTFNDNDLSENYLDKVFNSTDYLNLTANEDFPNNDNTSNEDDYVTFVPFPDFTTNDFTPSETDLEGEGINVEENSLVSSTLNNSNSPDKIEFTSPVASLILSETTSPSLKPNDIFSHTFRTESSEATQDNRNQTIAVSSGASTLSSYQTETTFAQEDDLDSIDNNLAREDFHDQFPAYDNDTTENIMEFENNLAPLDAKTEMEFVSSESSTVSQSLSVNDDKYFQTTEAVTKATGPADSVPTHPLFIMNVNATTETLISSTFTKENTKASTVFFTEPYFSSVQTDVPTTETEQTVTLPPDNITYSFENEIRDGLSNIAKAYLEDDALKFETSTPDDITIATFSEMSTLDGAVSKTSLNELSTHDNQITTNNLYQTTEHDNTIPVTTLSELLISDENQDVATVGDKEFDNELLHSSTEYSSTTLKNNFFQSPTSSYNTADSEASPNIPPKTDEFYPLESSNETDGKKYDALYPELHLVTTISTVSEQLDVQGAGTIVSNEMTETSTVGNLESTTITVSKENASYSMQFENSGPSSQAVTETHREGKHIPFSTTRTAYEKKPFKPTVPSSINPNYQTANNGVGALYNQIKPEDLTPDEKRNVMTVILQIHPLHYEREELNEKIIIAHLWLLHAIVEGYKNNSLNLTADVKRGSSAVAFEKLPQISYVLPTPDINIPNITLSFVAQHIGQNDTLAADYLLSILNMHKEDLKVLANVKSVKFFHGLPTEKYDFLTAIVEKYGIIVLVTCVIAVGMIILLLCVVIYYRRKARHSAHCLTDDLKPLGTLGAPIFPDFGIFRTLGPHSKNFDKLHRNMQEAMGIDLNPAVIILQDEIREKTVLNGNKVCSLDDDEGWLAPIDDVPVPEDINGPCIQDTKL